MSSLTPKVIVGLGNPGERYARTRHNVGFMAADALARQLGAGSWSSECQSLVCRAEVAGRPVLVAKPLTFMNLSGHAVQLLMLEHQAALQGVLLILDDLNLALGKIRIREGGSAGGHRGLESILRTLDTEEVLRLRLGIGEDDVPEDKAQFVLSDFPPDRARGLNEMIIKACDAVRMILTDSVSRAMSVFNT